MALYAGAGQWLLTHLDNSMDFTDVSAMLPSWASPALDGLEITLE